MVGNRMNVTVVRLYLKHFPFTLPYFFAVLQNPKHERGALGREIGHPMATQPIAFPQKANAWGRRGHRESQTGDSLYVLMVEAVRYRRYPARRHGVACWVWVQDFPTFSNATAESGGFLQDATSRDYGPGLSLTVRGILDLMHISVIPLQASPRSTINGQDSSRGPNGQSDCAVVQVGFAYLHISRQLLNFLSRFDSS
ncbi:hypothetical protein BKA81DRAFT_71709 [Phyllosticta paracitricarpa]